MLFFKCSQDKTQLDVKKNKASAKTIDIEEKKKQFYENNIKDIYNIAGYEIINLILEERVYKKNGNKINLEGVTLENFPSKLTDTINEKNVKIYAERLIEFQNNAIATFKSENLSTSLTILKKELLESSFYRDSIVGKNDKGEDRKKDSLYISLKTKIQKLFETSQNTIEQNLAPHLKTTSSLNTPTLDIPRKGEIKNLSYYLSKHKWWLFGMLLISVILHFFQFLHFKKEKKKLVNSLEVLKNKHTVLEQNTIEPQKNPSFLLNTIVKQCIHEEYKKLKQQLNSVYHEDCIEEIAIKFNSLISNTIDSAISKSFSNTEELKRFTSKYIDQHTATLKNELDNCISKEQASKEINSAIILDSFSNTVNTNIVSENQITNTITQFKEVMMLDMPKTMSKSQLNSEIEKLKKDITMNLQQKMKDNSVYYFAFADTKGALQHSKKTETIQRDSAIKLSLNPDDITKASFSLLIERDEMMLAGIMSYDSLLLPICELKSENFNSAGTHIKQIGPDGTMELENDVWKVKTKLPIKVI